MTFFYRVENEKQIGCYSDSKRFYTDSGNPYFLIFEQGNIHKPITVLTDYEMAEFKYYVNTQAEDLEYLGHKWVDIKNTKES